ncbi:hypothetical protein BX666DRAFT_2017673 [Dichotomocladium elegans]|nr:hypothetical protein BX666DRAFT_2017673 [Dichotomocladium elegans]
MEKYSRWRDAGTGIQPFLPPVPPRTESNLLSTLSNVIQSIVGPIQGVIKLLLVLIISLVYALLVPGLGLVLTPLGPVQRLWTRLFSFVLLRSVLFFSGFFIIKNDTVSLRRGKDARIHSGDVIVANWSSYIDVIYLAYKYRPVFTQVFPVDGKNIRRISLWQAIRLCTALPALTPEEAGAQKSSLYTLRELAEEAKERRWGPVIVFPEGTTSNGRALLKFASIFKSYQPSEREGRFHVLTFNLTVKRLASCDVPCNPAMTSSQQASDLASLAGTGMDDLVGGQLLVCLANMSRLRKTNLSMSDKRDFMEYYQMRYKGSARKQEQQAIRASNKKIK